MNLCHANVPMISSRVQGCVPILALVVHVYAGLLEQVEHQVNGFAASRCGV